MSGLERKVVVSGDVTVDWSLARRAPRGFKGTRHPDLEARASRRRGGAALLSDLVKVALARAPVEGPGTVLRGVDLVVDPVTPEDGRFSHSYAVWEPCEVRRAEQRRVWQG